jgi:hypothetical protein
MVRRRSSIPARSKPTQAEQNKGHGKQPITSRLWYPDDLDAVDGRPERDHSRSQIKNQSRSPVMFDPRLTRRKIGFTSGGAAAPPSAAGR